MPAMRISAITSMMPEPQMPVMPVPRVAAAKPGSSDQRSQPMTRKRGSRVDGVDLDPLDGAGGGALARGDLRALEGGAGGRGAGEHLAACCRAGSRRWCRRRPPASGRPRGSGPRRAPRRRRRRRRGRRCRAARRCGRRGACAGRSRSPRAPASAAVASAKGAWPSSTGSMPSSRWCMTGLPTITASKIRSGAMRASAAHLLDQRVQRPAHGAGHLGGAAGVQHGVADPAHQVLAEADLRVHQPGRGEHLAGDAGRRGGRRWWWSRRRWRGRRSCPRRSRARRAGCAPRRGRRRGRRRR